MSNVTVDELMATSQLLAATACCITCSGTVESERIAIIEMRKVKAKLRADLESLIKDRERLDFMLEKLLQNGGFYMSEYEDKT